MRADAQAAAAFGHGGKHSGACADDAVAASAFFLTLVDDAAASAACIVQQIAHGAAAARSEYDVGTGGSRAARGVTKTH